MEGFWVALVAAIGYAATLAAFWGPPRWWGRDDKGDRDVES